MPRKKKKKKSVHQTQGWSSGNYHAKKVIYLRRAMLKGRKDTKSYRGDPAEQ